MLAFQKPAFVFFSLKSLRLWINTTGWAKMEWSHFKRLFLKSVLLQ